MTVPRQQERLSRLSYEVLLKEATEDDLELLMAWRSHPQVYGGFAIQDAPLTWEEHLAWWQSREHRQDWVVLLQENGLARRVGSLNLTGLDRDIPEVGVYIGEVTLHGRGLGRKAIALAVDWLKGRGYRWCQAIIRDDNAASQRAFASVGFRLDVRVDGLTCRYCREL